MHSQPPPFLCVIGTSLTFLVSLMPSGGQDPKRDKLNDTPTPGSYKAKIIDASSWGEDIANPFTAITEAGKARLKKNGVDVGKLLKMDARLITGSYTGAATVDLVNRHCDTILVFGKGFLTHGNVTSAGPILAIEDAEFMGRKLDATAIVWFVEQSQPRADRLRGSPLILTHTDGDYGWRRPTNFLEAPDNCESIPRPFIREQENKKAKLTELIKTKRGTDILDETEPTANPFAKLTSKGKAKLKRRGINVERLSKLSARILTGEYLGEDARPFLNRNPDLILVLGTHFKSHGDIYSAGPIVALGDAHILGNVTGADIVWFLELSCPRREVTGLPVIISPTARRAHMTATSDDLWYGDYGWPAPTDQPRSLP